MEIFDYDKVLLLPRKCRVESRSECDPSLEFGGRRFKLPIAVGELLVDGDSVHARIAQL